MKRQTINIEVPSTSSAYDIAIGSGLLADSGQWARERLGLQTTRLAIVSNSKVFGLYGRQTENALRSAGFSVSHSLMKDGERHKTFATADSLLHFFSEIGLTRTDAVVALGGGVVGDLAGFAASIYLRGIPVLQVPTTLLAMIDSSVGGKTGVNTSFGKNLVGAFHQPQGVLIDVEVLRTLPRRELTGGFCEAIKQGAVGGRKLLVQIADFLSVVPAGGFSERIQSGSFRSQLSDLVAAQIEFKASIVAGDERESTNRTDSRSRKILNFGHTFAHALEKVSNYKRFRHGEAVGHGILFAADLSKSLALCAEKDVNLLYDVVHRAGPLPALSNIDENEVLDAFGADKKKLSGGLQMVLLKGIGKPVIVNDRDIPRITLRRVLRKFLHQQA
jgi:3-dehydroquinate synthase